MGEKLDISVVVPVYNERESVKPLAERLLKVLPELGSFEVIIVNDGSTDGTVEALKEIFDANPGLFKTIHLRKNYGKSIALQNGFDATSGDIIVMMDGDLQDKPEELPKLLAALEKDDLDVVTGWKIYRRDPLSKTIPSKFFNKIIRHFSGLNIHDFNCGFKAMRRPCLDSFRLYGHLHRFILVLISRHGFKIGEVPVEHAPREFGVSKYGTNRIYHGMMDILTVFFLVRYLKSPLYFFGFYGIIFIFTSIPLGVYYFSFHFYYLFSGSYIHALVNHPLWVLSPLMFLLGIIMIFFGLIGELLTHYLNTSNDPGPVILARVGFAEDDSDS
jgi:glycosyltransferase involved in cell wall biosynthesis